ncbi:MAG: hypothetical protein RL514_1914 [Verrucomicrobiota bacterium]|jgi:two-component system nitrate/nitrite response regulator NarL
MTRHSILIVDDHPLVRRGIRGLLQGQPDFHVVGEAADGLTALHLVEQHRPDVVVLDIVMPMLGGLDLLRQMAQNKVRPRTVVLSLHDDPGYVRQAMQLGAAGYVLKHSASTFLVAAVRDALAGRFFSSCPLAPEAPAQPEAAQSRRVERSELLTAEERLVLRMLAAGVSEEQMAPKLAYQPLAIPMLCRNIALKFGLQNPADVRQLATRWAREN